MNFSSIKQLKYNPTDKEAGLSPAFIYWSLTFTHAQEFF